MCLPPVFDAGDAARPHFALLRELRDALRTRLGLPLSELSMGMSGDFEGCCGRRGHHGAHRHGYFWAASCQDVMIWHKACYKGLSGSRF